MEEFGACEYGIFETTEEAIEAAAEAQLILRDTSLEDREKYIQAVRDKALPILEDLCKMEFEETGYGRVEDKMGKNFGALMLSPGTEAIPTGIYASEKGLTVEYYVPFGVVGAITPVTNPIATPFGNGICCMAGGNTVVFNAHPNAVKTTSYAIQLFNKAVVEAGGPNNILVAPKVPTMETLDVIMESPKVQMLIGTGGEAMVHTLMSSSKKVIAAGPGNPPTIVDETTDVKAAAQALYGAVPFENNMLCVTEKEAFVVDAVFDEFMDEMVACGARKLNADEVEKLVAECIMKLDNGALMAVKKYVGKDANVILEGAGVEPSEGDLQLAVFEADKDNPFVACEQMMPIFPIVRCKDFDEALELAVKAENGCRHSASCWSMDFARITRAAQELGVTNFAANGTTTAGTGVGGTGTGSATIATGTGEGFTNPSTFCRRRRVAFGGGLGYAG